jgi:hypothetical protein
VVEECAAVGEWVEEAPPLAPQQGEEATPPTPPPGEMSLGREMMGEVSQVSLLEKGQERRHGGERIGQVWRSEANTKP